MASSNKDNTMEYDKQMHKKGPKTKNHLAGRLNKFQETINKSQSPTPTPINSIHNQEEIDSKLLNQIKSLHQLIKENGQQGDYAIQITFGQLLIIYGKEKLNELNDLLCKSRDYGYLNYPLNEHFQEDRDEDIFIKLIKTPY